MVHFSLQLILLPSKWLRYGKYSFDFQLKFLIELENADNVQPVLLQGLKNVVNMLEPEYHKELLGGIFPLFTKQISHMLIDLLHSAELIVMVVLKRLIEHARSPLNFMVILDEIKDLKRVNFLYKYPNIN